MQLRVLQPPEFYQVEDLFREAFTGPLPESGFIVVAEEDGRIIGFSVLQQVWHAEPVYVKPEWRSSGVFSRLVNKMLELLPKTSAGVFILTPSEKQGRVLEYLGFEYLKAFKVFRWIRKD